MKHQIGHHIIEHKGKLIFARWDGHNFHSEHGQHVDGESKQVVDIIALGCPSGCKCSSNGDGSVNVNCSPQALQSE